MDLKPLRAFVAVAEHGTVSTAAERLHVTQPALSRQIAGLERDFGFRLFARVGRRLALTELGEQLLADSRILLSQVGALEERAQTLRSGALEVVNVAASALTLEALFPSFLPRYAEAVPNVRLNLIEAHAQQHLAMLERGDAHLSINVVNAVPVDPLRFTSYLLPQFHVLAACAHSFDIPPGDTIDIRRLAEYPLLLSKATNATRSLFDAACRIAHVRPNIRLESDAAHAVLALAAAGYGVAVAPSILRPHPRVMRSLRVTHARKSLDIDLAVIWDKRRIVPRYAAEFANLLADHILVEFVGARLPGVGAIARPQSAAGAMKSDERVRATPR
jgi:DNA-binding transcriptional LysR family regulator